MKLSRFEAMEIYEYTAAGVCRKCCMYTCRYKGTKLIKAFVPFPFAAE